jgi:hypothetical protein
MRGLPPRVTISPMTSGVPLRICLEFMPGAQPVMGSVRCGVHPEREFAGWSELFAALESEVRSHEEELAAQAKTL